MLKANGKIANRTLAKPAVNNNFCEPARNQHERLSYWCVRENRANNMTQDPLFGSMKFDRFSLLN